MPSNGQFLAIVQPVRLQDTGWEIRVRDPNDFTTLIAVVPEFSSFTISPELNGAGAGSISINRDSPYWNSILPNGNSAATLQAYEYLWEAWENGSLRFQWLGRNVEETRVDADETRAITISGPGTAELLKMAKIFRPGWPKPVPTKSLNNPEFSSGSNTTPAYKWIFPTRWPAMRMWHTLFTTAQKRGTIPWVKPTFTALKDSAGAPWEYVPTTATASGVGFSPDNGQDLMEFLADCTGQDYSKYFAEYTEWVMWPNFKLDVRKTIGAHREKKVIFYDGMIEAKMRSRNREEIANVILVLDNVGKDSHVTDSTSIRKWNRREMYYTDAAGTVDSKNRRTAIGRNLLRQYKDERSEWSITVPANLPYRRPFYDYNVGDWIGVSEWDRDHPNIVSAYRVQAITVTVEGETPTVELTLQSKFDYRLAQLQKQLTWLRFRAKDVTTPVTDEDALNTNNGNATFPLNGYADGIRVFIQDNDPGDKLARPGDFWFDTDYAPESGYVYLPSDTTNKTTNWTTSNPYNAPQFHYYDPNKQL